MSFKQGDIIQYCDELFEVEQNYGRSGSVWEVDSDYKRTGVKVSNFRWACYGEECTLVRPA